jgi:purine-nucleoside phosphorylase
VAPILILATLGSDINGQETDEVTQTYAPPVKWLLRVRGIGYAPSMPRSLITIPADELAAQVHTAAAHIAQSWEEPPQVGIILGTGLSPFVDGIDDACSLAYSDIPHFPVSMAPGHNGHLVCGRIKDVACLAMAGRFHVYEGYPAWQITLPVRVMHRLGIETLIVTNAAGGVNPCYRIGDVMAVADHINLMGENLLIGETNAALGDRVFDLSTPYDPDLLDRAQAIARREDFVCHRGVYVALSGPNYETRAEYRMVRRIGGDVVGMSSVPEVIVARQLGLRVLALSTVTNICLPDALTATAGEDVVAAAAQAEHRMRAIVVNLLREGAAGPI